MIRSIRVFGPAYRDRVSRVDRPLLNRGIVDGSFEGVREEAIGPTRIVDQDGGSIEIREYRPGGGEQPGQLVRIQGRMCDRGGPWTRVVCCQSTSESLGGMGAGFAAALRGDLVSALGGDDSGLDSTGEWISRELARHEIPHEPILIPGRESDLTWIISSGRFGDKLAIGFRGCHSSVTSLGPADLARACDLLVVAGFANHLVAQTLAIPASIRMLAPAIRNMTETATPLASLAGRFHYLACNRREWEAMDGREHVARNTPLISITDGPAGCRVLYLDRDARVNEFSLPAFPRDEPPIDTNRAGEAFAATLISALLDGGWDPGANDPAMIRGAALRGSVAAALVLDMEEFGFPGAGAIDQALLAGRVKRYDPLPK